MVGNNMIKSINGWSLPAKWNEAAHLPKTFRLLKALGFDGVELTFDTQAGAINFSSTTDEMLALRKAAAEAGIALTTLASGAFWASNFGQDDAEKRAQARKIALKMLELGQALGVDTLLVVPAAVDIVFIPSEPVVEYETAFERTITAMRELAPACEFHQVRIGLENVWNNLFLSPLEMRNVIDEIASPWIGSYFDVGNVLVNGYPEQWINILDKRIFAVHLKDYRKSIGNINGFVDLLEGDVDWHAVMTALQKINYQGALTAEIGPTYRHNELARLENCSNVMDWLLGRKTMAGEMEKLMRG